MDASPPALAAALLPRPGEHLSGFVRRLARANGLTRLAQLYGIVGQRQGFWQSGEDRQWILLAAATGLPVESFATLRLPARSGTTTDLTDVGGLRLRPAQLRKQNFPHCPACLEEDAMIRARGSSIRSPRARGMAYGSAMTVRAADAASA